jgi:predicted nucleic acid-binding protein
MANVIIDTSAWIQFFRYGSDVVSQLVAELVRNDQAVMTGVVLTELLQGIKTDKERQHLTALFSSLPFIEIVREDWQNAGEDLQALRRRGITVPVTDAVIATVAHRRGLPVLTTDPHFKSFKVNLVGPKI